MKPGGVTRHQFLLDPRIPYTSHNSGACIAVEAAKGIEEVAFTFDFVAERAAEGSDPGVCLAEMAQVHKTVIQFGRSATTEVLTMEQAYEVAGNAKLQLKGLGGTNQGVIGALGSVGLRAGGNEGRFIDWPGLRDIAERVAEKAITSLGITIEYKQNGRRPLPDDFYETYDWVRPNLVQGKPVWLVEWSNNYDAWIPVDRKKNRPLE
jgi:hypothetical protein